MLRSSDELLWIAASCEVGSEHPIAKALVQKFNESTWSKDVALCETCSFETKSGGGLNATLCTPWTKLSMMSSNGQSSLSSQSERADHFCRTNNLDVVIGNRLLMVGSNYHVSRELDEKAQVLEQEGETVVFVGLWDESRNVGVVCGFIAVADIVRTEARATVEALTSLGMQIWMATGDNPRTAAFVARQVGISNVLSEVRSKHRVTHCFLISLIFCAAY